MFTQKKGNAGFFYNKPRKLSGSSNTVVIGTNKSLIQLKQKIIKGRIEDLDILITEWGAGLETIEQIEALGVKVIVVPKEKNNIKY